jgi:hypothetical protein
MIIHDLDVRRSGGALWPLEADPPLIIDPDTPLPLTASSESFQPVASQPGQIRKSRGCFEPSEAHQRLSPNAFKLPDKFTAPQLLGIPVTETLDHPFGISSEASCVPQHTTRICAPTQSVIAALLKPVVCMKGRPLTSDVAACYPCYLQKKYRLAGSRGSRR